MMRQIKKERITLHFYRCRLCILRAGLGFKLNYWLLRTSIAHFISYLQMHKHAKHCHTGKERYFISVFAPGCN